MQKNEMPLNYQEVFRHNIFIKNIAPLLCEQVELSAMSRKQSHGTTLSLFLVHHAILTHDSELFTFTPVTDLCPPYISKVAPVSSPSSIPVPLLQSRHLPLPKKVNTLE